MAITVALAGDTMLGRGVAERLETAPAASLVSRDVAEVARGADLFVLNLECCISERGTPVRGKRFTFRAPPAAVETLRYLDVDCVTLANNHALDFGEDALLDTLRFLDSAGIVSVGAGPDEAAARDPVTLEAKGVHLTVIGVSDHPATFAAGPSTPGIAYADLGRRMPSWLVDAVEEAAPSPSSAVLVTPHWGPNMTPAPVPHVRAAAAALVEAGATVIAAHSAHVFHGVRGNVLFDLGDFLDDYAVDPVVRNDLGLLFLVTLSSGGVSAIEAVPLKLEYCHTRLAGGEDADWIERRFREVCAALGTEVRRERDRLVVLPPDRRLDPPPGPAA